MRPDVSGQWWREKYLTDRKRASNKYSNKHNLKIKTRLKDFNNSNVKSSNKWLKFDNRSRKF